MTFKGNFPNKKLNNGGKLFVYTADLNFTSSELSLQKRNQLSFNRLVCNITLKASQGSTSNIEHHIETHKAENLDLRKTLWFEPYDSDSQTPSNKFSIDNETIKMVRYFIASNIADKNFDCPYFRYLLRGYSVQVPCIDTFSNSVLPSIVQSVKDE